MRHWFPAYLTDDNSNSNAVNCPSLLTHNSAVWNQARAVVSFLSLCHQFDFVFFLPLNCSTIIPKVNQVERARFSRFPNPV